MLMKKNPGALPMVPSRSIEAIYIARILLGDLVSDADLFGIVVGVAG